MFKLCIDAGHGYNTAGKRTPDGVREWAMNNGVVNNVINLLKDYEVEITRLDDPTGKTDVALASRTNKVKAVNPDLYLSIHHNANTGSWGHWTGFEIYYMKNNLPLAQKILPYLKAEFLKPINGVNIKEHGNNAIRTSNLHVLREVGSIPALLVEGGYMDSLNDYKYITNTDGQLNYARGIANFIIKEYKLKELKPVKWEEIIDKHTDNPMEWKKGINAIVKLTKDESNVGDIEIFKFLPALLEKIYNR